VIASLEGRTIGRVGHPLVQEPLDQVHPVGAPGQHGRGGAGGVRQLGGAVLSVERGDRFFAHRPSPTPTGRNSRRPPPIATSTSGAAAAVAAAPSRCRGALAGGAVIAWKSWVAMSV
jgi:succinate dehydrogenase/fumarate reductase flavoprotein subunit